jgi:hypothetical protein
MTGSLTTDYFALIQHPHTPQIMVQRTGTQWALPTFHAAGRRLWQDVAHVNQGFAAWLGGPVQTLRCLDLRYAPDQERLSKIYAMQPLHLDWALPSNSAWVPLTHLAAHSFSPPEHAQVVAAWQAWRTAPSPLRAPWYQSGWWAEATRWASERLAVAGTPLVGPITQVRTWQRSAVLHLPTSAGSAYFKAVPPICAHEPALTTLLAAHDPAHFAAPIAVDPQRGWLLMRAVSGESLATLRDDLAPWEAALRRFAEIQIALIPRTDQIQALGVPVRPLSALASDFAALLADPAATLPDEPAGLNATQLAQLHTLAAHLPAYIDALQRCAIPDTLEHGDLWPGQIIVARQQIAFIDWADSSIAHPFFSLLLLLEEIEDYVPKEPGVRERLRNAYLAPWQRYSTREQLVPAFEQAQLLAAVHHALAYHRVVLPNIELKWELELMLPFYLKLLLRIAAQQGLV